MANKGSKGDFQRATKIPFGRTVTPAEAAGIKDGERGSALQKRCEPLHAFIVHFDAAPSSKRR